jgi:hypothetical protein
MIIFSGYALIKQGKSNISYLEKRELSYIKPLTTKEWFSKEFQASVDSSIIDNFFKRNDCLKYYNKINMKLNIIGNKSTSVFFKKYLDKMIILQNINEKVSYIDEISYLVRNPYIYDKDIGLGIINNINKIKILSNKKDDVKFYIYLPLMANENDIFDISNLNTSYLRLFDSLSIPFKNLEVNNIHDLEKVYFSTDHHWSHIGSYQGYTDIINLLFKGAEKAKFPVSEKEFIDVRFFGSHSRAIAHSVKTRGDSISKYIFDLPEYDLYVDGVLTETYGHYEDYVKGNVDNSKDFDHYGWMYQNRKGKIIFDTKQENLENMLVISDSMSNSLRDVLASHFDKTIFINLDEYQRTYGEFIIEEYIDKYEIDKVLVMVVLGNYFPEGELKYLNVK